jgi:hypothetical protein
MRGYKVDRDSLQNVFDEQVDRLKRFRFHMALSNGGPNRFSQSISDLRARLPESVRVGNHNFPLLIVIPDSLVPVKWQISRIRYGRGRGYSFLPMENLTDSWAFPYVLLDVDDGDSTQGKSPYWAMDKFQRQGRKGFGLEQGVALAIQYPEIFHHHNIHLAQSQILADEPGEVYVLDMWQYGGQIKIKRDSARLRDPRWGSPSYQALFS